MRTTRVAAFGLCATLVLSMSLVGCGSGGSSTSAGASRAPIDDTRAGSTQAPVQSAAQAPRQGMSTGKKVAILAGAAALYYMYNKNKQKRAQGDTSQPQYYLSKNGRVYYREANGQAHWVTPPPQGIQVPMEEAQQYQRLQGYNNGNGMSLQDYMGQGMARPDEYVGSQGGGYGGR